MSEVKVFVPVKAVFLETGDIRPLELAWEDGRVFQIDRVVDVRPAASLKAGGQGDRYTVIINGRQSYLFFERSHTYHGTNIGRWFVEKKLLK